MNLSLIDKFWIFIKTPLPHRNRLSYGVIVEYRFNPDRRWRFDFAWPDKKVAVEMEGGIWIKGRHNRGRGMINDMIKYNWAVRNLANIITGREEAGGRG